MIKAKKQSDKDGLWEVQNNSRVLVAPSSGYLEKMEGNEAVFLATREADDFEIKISAEVMKINRAQAIANLKASGDLPADFK